VTLIVIFMHAAQEPAYSNGCSPLRRMLDTHAIV